MLRLLKKRWVIIAGSSSCASVTQKQFCCSLYIPWFWRQGHYYCIPIKTHSTEDFFFFLFSLFFNVVRTKNPIVPSSLVILALGNYNHPWALYDLGFISNIASAFSCSFIVIIFILGYLLYSSLSCLIFIFVLFPNL